MTPPQGLVGVKKGKVCKLKKSLYGLKQACREWNAEFTRHLISFGFLASVYDPCLFTKGSGDSLLCLLVYVDDILISESSLHLIKEFKTFLDSVFTIKDLGPAKFFLGMEIARGSEGTALNQRKYVLEILSSYGMLCCKPTATPFSPGLTLAQGTDPVLQQPDLYRSLVGQLLYLNLTRPDITYATQQLTQFVAKPTSVHWNAVIHVLRYLKRCPSLDVFYFSSFDPILRGYFDADWGTCKDTCKSLTGFCIFLGNNLLS